MYTLTNWHFSMYKDTCIAWGIVSGHSKFSDGTLIHTSRIKQVSVDEEQACLLVHTKSGSQYRLSFADIALDCIEDTRSRLHQLGISADLLDRCEKICADSEKAKMLESGSVLNSSELFLEMCGVSALLAYFKDETGELHQIQITIHSGMYQDSVLITDWYNELVDFRYFPNDCIKPYHWSDGLNAVKIKNSGRKDIIFSGSHREIVCRSGEITVIESGEYDGEGLFSPDAVNGKSRKDSLNYIRRKPAASLW